MPITTLVAGNVVTASGLNSNFSACLLKDTAGTVSVTHTYTASQTFNAGFTGGALADININSLLSVLASTGRITSNVGNDVALYVNPTTGTNYGLIQFTNTSGSLIAGIEGSSAAASTTGSTAYAGLLVVKTAKSLQLGTNNTVDLTLASGGAAMTYGKGTTGTNGAAFVVNGGSGSGGGPAVQLQANSVRIGQLLRHAAEYGGTSDAITLMGETASGLELFAPHASGVIIFASGGTTERARFVAAGQLQFANITATPAGLSDGQIWYDGTNFRTRQGGATKTITVS